MASLSFNRKRRQESAAVDPGNAVAGTPTRTPDSGLVTEIAHILFVEIIGYSRMGATQQAGVQRELHHQVQGTGEVVLGRQEKKLIVQPTGGGIALLFFRDLLSPLRCAIQIQTAVSRNDAEIRARTGCTLPLRMGIHSGPVILTTDSNSRSDAGGEGIHRAHQVMGCGDAGSVLLSSDYAERLRTMDPWPRYLQNIGECVASQGDTLHLYNFYGKFDGVACGVPGRPQQVIESEKARRAHPQQTPKRGQTRAAMRPVIIGFSVIFTLIGLSYGLWSNNPDIRKEFGVIEPAKKASPGVITRRPAKKEKRSVASRTVRSQRHEQTGTPPRPVEAGVTPQLPIGNAGTVVTMPDLTGKSYTAAESLARNVGLRIVRSDRSEYSLEFPQGQVYQQSIAVGVALEPGKQIFVRVSRGVPPR